MLRQRIKMNDIVQPVSEFRMKNFSMAFFPLFAVSWLIAEADGFAAHLPVPALDVIIMMTFLKSAFLPLLSVRVA